MESTETTECRRALGIIEKGEPQELLEGAYDFMSAFVDKTSNGGLLREAARTLLGAARRKGS